MIVSCTNCKKKYTVDEKKFRRKTEQFKCSACSTLFTVENPGLDHERLESSQEISAAMEKKGEEGVRFGLYPKSILLMLFISLVPVGLFFAATYIETGNRVRTDTKILMQQATAGLLDHIDEWVDKNRRMLETASRLGSITSMDTAEQTTTLTTIQEQYPWMYLVFTLDKHGMNTARNDGKPLKDYSDRNYYRDIKNGQTFSWQTLIGKTSKKPALVMAVPIMSGGEMVGVLAAAMTTEVISQSVARWTKGKTGFAFLVDEKNKVIAHQIKAYVQEEKTLADHPVLLLSSGEKSGFNEFADRSGAYHIASFKKNAMGWNIVVQQGAGEAYGTLKKFQRYILLVFFLTIGIVTLIAWFSARAISRPILEMTEAATQMSLGDFNVQINVNSRDEIGMLARSIMRMQTSLAYAMKRLNKT